MSDSINTGGPAFPIASDTIGHCSGMELRDYFAAKAITAFVFAGSDYDRAATEAYAQADAMLRAREVKQ